jgi:hypothetical protein
MANRIPLIVNASASQIQEVPSGDVVNFDNKVVLTNSTASSSASVGAVVVTGGVGIGGVLNIGGALNVDGDITAFASSDETLKENLVAIPNAVSKVGIITGYTFSWKADTGYDYLDSKTDTGVIAQQVEALGLPGITTTRDDGIKAVRYDRLVPLLIEAIKELDGRIKTLEG